MAALAPLLIIDGSTSSASVRSPDSFPICQAGSRAAPTHRVWQRRPRAAYSAPACPRPHLPRASSAYAADSPRPRPTSTRTAVGSTLLRPLCPHDRLCSSPSVCLCTPARLPTRSLAPGRSMASTGSPLLQFMPPGTS
ncbi:hypothetical protein ZWY2020_006453 [Hordeum vulgare]|nr:hypothetical protein ZWY2020_006453 [Hordeum vulgare]